MTFHDPKAEALGQTEENKYVLRQPIEAVEEQEYGQIYFIKGYEFYESGTGKIACKKDVLVPVSERKEHLREQILEKLVEHGARFFSDIEVDRKAYGLHKDSDEVRGHMELQARIDFTQEILAVVFGDSDD